MSDTKALGERCLGLVFDHFADHFAADLAAQDTNRPDQRALTVPAVGRPQEWPVDLYEVNVEAPHVVVRGGACAEVIEANGVSGGPELREKFLCLGKILHGGRFGEFE